MPSPCGHGKPVPTCTAADDRDGRYVCSGGDGFMAKTGQLNEVLPPDAFCSTASRYRVLSTQRTLVMNEGRPGGRSAHLRARIRPLYLRNRAYIAPIRCRRRRCQPVRPWQVIFADRNARPQSSRRNWRRKLHSSSPHTPGTNRSSGANTPCIASFSRASASASLSPARIGVIRRTSAPSLRPLRTLASVISSFA